jgi:hypothetical protein
MLKKTFALIFIVFLSSCGYEAIHSKKNSINYNFSINSLTFNDNDEINLKIKEKLNKYTLNRLDRDFTLKVKTTNTKKVLAKNISGDPTGFESSLIMAVEVILDKKIKNNLLFTESFNYNNNINKSSLEMYEKEIKINLAETVTNKLIYKLSNIR